MKILASIVLIVAAIGAAVAQTHVTVPGSVIFECPTCGQGGPMLASSARLSLTAQPIMSADVTSNTVHFTDGISSDLQLPVPSALGAYDVFVNGAAITSAPFNPARVRTFYVGSIYVSVAGQLTAHFSAGHERKWEIYNAYNQRDIVLSVVTQEQDLQYCPTNQNWQPFNHNPFNRGTVFTGEPTAVAVDYIQGGYLNTRDAGIYGLLNAIDWNSSIVGKVGGGGQDGTAFVGGVSGVAHYANPVATGINVATMMVRGLPNNNPLHCTRPNASVLYSAAGPLWGYNIDANVLMTIKWRG